MEKIIKIPYEAFHKFYEKLNVPSKYDEKFLFELFENLIESCNETDFSGINEGLFKNINVFQLFLYMIAEYDFLASPLNEEGIKQLNENESLMSMVISMALDKYITNEKINLNEVFYVSKYSTNISSLMLYLNFMNKVMNQYSLKH